MQEAIIFPFFMTAAEAAKRQEKQQEQQKPAISANQDQFNQSTQNYLSNFWHWKASYEARPTLIEHLTK